MAKEIRFEKSFSSHEKYKYISENYMLPKWFNYNDIDWVRYYPSKNGKLYIPNSKRTIYITTKKTEEMYICDDEKVKIHSIFVKYLAYLNMYLNTDNDLTDEEIKIILSIKICDYDWLFMWSNPEYDKNNEELLLQKISV